VPQHCEVKSTWARRFFSGVPETPRAGGQRESVGSQVARLRGSPEPRAAPRTFLKPFMRADTAEFCSSCHKVHLDVPVNHYRGFAASMNMTMAASGISGQGARLLLPEVADELRGLPHAPSALER